MAAVTGKGGTVSYAGGNVATINSWSIDIGSDMHDVTSFSTALAQWRDYIVGLSGWTGSIDGIFNPASTGQNNMINATLTPTTATVVLEMDQTGGGKFTGSVFLESGSFSVDIGSPVDVSWSMQGTGSLTYSTST